MPSVNIGNQQRNYWLNGFNMFVQDSWKATPKLTLNYGLNWSYQSPIDNPADLISTFVPQNGGIQYLGHVVLTAFGRVIPAPRFPGRGSALPTRLSAAENL